MEMEMTIMLDRMCDLGFCKLKIGVFSLKLLFEPANDTI
jgi:hypothetical protein